MKVVIYFFVLAAPFLGFASSDFISSDAFCYISNPALSLGTDLPSSCPHGQIGSPHIDTEPRLQKRSPSGLNVEMLMEKADKHRGITTIPLSQLDPVQQSKVNKWADRAMQAGGWNTDGIYNQESHYRSKTDFLSKMVKGETQPEQLASAEAKLQMWEQHIANHRPSNVDAASYLRQEAQHYIDHYSQKIQEVKEEEPNAYTDIIIRQETERMNEWERKLKALDGVSEPGSETARDWADHYHTSRISSGRLEQIYSDKAAQNIPHHRQVDNIDHANNQREAKQKATENWMRWRAVAHKQERGGSSSQRYKR